MKRKLLLSVLAVALGTASAWADGFVLDRSQWNVSAMNETPAGWEGKSTKNYDNGPVGCIIDDDETSYWHSDWSSGSGANLPQAFMIDCGESVTFQGFGYFPRPNQGNGTMTQYEIYVSDSAFDLSALPTEGAAITGNFTWPGGASFTQVAFAEQQLTGRYILVKSTASKSGTYFTCADFNLYTSESDYYKAKLSFDLENAHNYIGTDPGFYSQAVVDAAQAVSDDNNATAQAVKDAINSLVPNSIVSGKTYVLVSAYPGYLQKQSVEKAMYNNENVLGWKTLSLTDPTFFWNITATENGYSIQSVSSEKYVAGPGELADAAGNVTFNPLGKGQFNILCNGTFHTNQHGAGAGLGSNIVSWDGGVDSQSAWYVREAEVHTSATFDYIYTYEGQTKRITVEGAVGEDFPALTGIPYGLTATKPEGKVANGQSDVEIQLNGDNFPFHYAADVASISHWYTMDIHGNEAAYVIYGDDEAPKVKNDPAYDDNGRLKSEYYKWGFVGHPYTGFQIYNAGAQKYMYQANDADEQVTFAQEGNSFMTCATVSGLANSLAFKVEGRSNYINHRGEKLQGWTAADGGSSFRIYEIDLDEQEALAQAANFLAYDAALEKATTLATFIGEGVNKYTEAQPGTLAAALAAVGEKYAERDGYTAANQAEIDQDTQTLQAAIDGISINQPVKGAYYRFIPAKLDNIHYLTSPNEGEDINTTSTTAAYNNIFQLTDSNKLLAVNRNMYVTAQMSNFAPMKLTEAEEDGFTLEFVGSEVLTGAYNIHVADSQFYLYDWTTYNAAQTLVNNDPKGNRCQWRLEVVPAEDLVDIHKTEALALLQKVPAVLITEAEATAGAAAIEAAATVAAVDEALNATMGKVGGQFAIYCTHRDADKDYIYENAQGELYASVDVNTPSKVWTIAYSNGAFTIANAYSKKYIQTNPGQSTRFHTAEEPKGFDIAAGGAENTVTFGTTGRNFLHEADYHGVVGWEQNTDASYWFLERIEDLPAEPTVGKLTELVRDAQGEGEDAPKKKNIDSFHNAILRK